PREYEENLEIDSQICERYNDKRVLMVGSLKTYKGIFQFLKVAEKCPSYTFCLVINSDDDEFHDFKNKTYIPSNVEVIVRPDNLPEIYKSSMVLLNLTLPDLCKETFGLTVIEGLSKGCPAIVPPAGGPVEITNNDCAFIVDPYDIKKLVDTLNILLGDPILWRRMSTASVLQSKKFSIKSYQSNIKNIIFEN
ncbi:glycosyltransferase, partial [Vibrio cholerae]|nr:glycosyltransferase [Vibrio cholerae]